MKRIKMFLRFLRGTIPAFVVTVFAIYTLRVLWIDMSPYSDWFYYASVESVEKEYKVGEKPYFVSNRIIFQEIEAEYNDVLYCKYEGQENHTVISSYNSSSFMKKESLGGSWKYQQEVPTEPAECFIYSTITIKPLYGVVKRQNVQSNTFYFVD